jgi:hypothetical protein
MEAVKVDVGTNSRGKSEQSEERYGRPNRRAGQ